MKNKRYVCHKVFTIGQHEKEEQWINEMAAKGMMLTRVGFCRYEFEESTPNEYQYRLEFLEYMPNHANSASYLNFLDEYGVEHIGSVFRWVYLRKKTSNDESFDLYSDRGSIYKHYQRIYYFSLTMGIAELFIGVGNFHNFIMYPSLRNPSTYFSLLFAAITALFLLTAASLRRKMKRLKKEATLFDN